MAGNERYVSGKSAPLDFHNVEAALIKGQNPYATILSCSDSRVSPEHCFDEALGDLFVARVAGSYLINDNLATLEYAVAVLNTPSSWCSVMRVAERLKQRSMRLIITEISLATSSYWLAP